MFSELDGLNNTFLMAQPIKKSLNACYSILSVPVPQNQIMLLMCSSLSFVRVTYLKDLRRCR